MASYDLYIQQHVRKMIQERDVTYNRAYIFLEDEFALVKDEDGNCYYTQEELEDAKSLGSIPSTGTDHSVTSGGPVSEGTHRELFGSLGDNTE